MVRRQGEFGFGKDYACPLCGFPRAGPEGPCPSCAPRAMRRTDPEIVQQALEANDDGDSFVRKVGCVVFAGTVLGVVFVGMKVYDWLFE